MSKLLELLERIDEGTPAPLGFGAAATRRPTSPMALLAYAPPNSDPSALASAPVDGVIIAADSADAAQGPEGTLWGAWLEAASHEQAESLKERGCDFLVFGAEKMPLESLVVEGMGRLMVLDGSLSEERRQALDALPIDAVLVVPSGDQSPLTVLGLLDIMVATGGTGKPVLLLRATTPSRAEVEALRDAGVVGLVMDLSRVDASALREMRETIDSLPRPRSRRERRTALLPRQPAGRHVAEDEEDEDEE